MSIMVLLAWGELTDDYLVKIMKVYYLLHTLYSFIQLISTIPSIIQFIDYYHRPPSASNAFSMYMLCF